LRGAGLVILFGLARGCAPDDHQLRVRLEDRDPAVKARAIATIAEERRADLAPALVDRLDDEDPAIRLYAILALEKLTGTRRGFDYAASRADRREAVTSWRSWVVKRAAASDDADSSAATE
jgi:hypothetical protein